MTDHRVSDFMFMKSNYNVAHASKYPVKATSDTVSVNPLPLLQQYICVGYDSRELVDVLKYELFVYPTTLFGATGTMLQSGKPAWANPLNSMENRTDTCVIMWKLCKYERKGGEKQLCLIVVLLSKMTFIWDGRNPLSVTGSYSQDTWHAHHVKRTLSPTEWTNRGAFICWVMEWWHLLGLIRSLVNSAQVQFIDSPHQN